MAIVIIIIIIIRRQTAQRYDVCNNSPRLALLAVLAMEADSNSCVFVERIIERCANKVSLK